MNWGLINEHIGETCSTERYTFGIPHVTSAGRIEVQFRIQGDVVSNILVVPVAEIACLTDESEGKFRINGSFLQGDNASVSITRKTNELLRYKVFHVYDGGQSFTPLLDLRAPEACTESYDIDISDPSYPEGETHIIEYVYVRVIANGTPPTFDDYIVLDNRN